MMMTVATGDLELYMGSEQRCTFIKFSLVTHKIREKHKGIYPLDSAILESEYTFIVSQRFLRRTCTNGNEVLNKMYQIGSDVVQSNFPV